MNRKGGRGIFLGQGAVALSSSPHGSSGCPWEMRPPALVSRLTPMMPGVVGIGETAGEEKGCRFVPVGCVDWSSTRPPGLYGSNPSRIQTRSDAYLNQAEDSLESCLDFNGQVPGCTTSSILNRTGDGVFGYLSAFRLLKNTCPHEM